MYFKTFPAKVGKVLFFMKVRIESSVFGRSPNSQAPEALITFAGAAAYGVSAGEGVFRCPQEFMPKTSFFTENANLA